MMLYQCGGESAVGVLDMMLLGLGLRMDESGHITAQAAVHWACQTIGRDSRLAPIGRRRFLVAGPAGRIHGAAERIVCLVPKPHSPHHPHFFLTRFHSGVRSLSP